MTEDGHYSCNDVENQEFPMSEFIFNFNAEYPEKGHVPAEMRDTTMHEERGEDCHPGRHRGLDHTGQGFSPGQLNRNEAPGKEEFGKGLLSPPLITTNPLMNNSYKKTRLHNPMRDMTTKGRTDWVKIADMGGDLN